MFDSGISVKDLVYELKNTEVDIALEIPNKIYVEWLNALQQLLYTEVIKEQKKYHFDNTVELPGFEVVPVVFSHRMVTVGIPMSVIAPGENESKPRFEDIHAVYLSDGTQLIKSTVASGEIFPNTYYKENNDLTVRIASAYMDSPIDIIYHVRPALIDVNEEDDIDDSNVMLPIEFIDLAKAKLRGEAYKLANEDSIAAKWLNDYNVNLETFKAWISSKASKFGI